MPGFFDWLNPIGGFISGLGNIAGTISGIVNQKKTSDLMESQQEESQREFNEQMNIANRNAQLQQEVFDFQKAQQEKAYEREDTSYQRTVQDMRAAGLSPLMMSGTDGSGSMISPVTPQMDVDSAYATKANNRANQLQLQQQKVDLASRKMDFLVKAGEALQTIRDPSLTEEDRIGANLSNQALRIKNLIDSMDASFLKNNGFSGSMSEKQMLTQIINKGGYYDTENAWHSCNLTDYAQYYNLANDSPTNIAGGDLARLNAGVANETSNVTKGKDVGEVLKETFSSLTETPENYLEDIVDEAMESFDDQDDIVTGQIEEFRNNYEALTESEKKVFNQSVITKFNSHRTEKNVLIKNEKKAF